MCEEYPYDDDMEEADAMDDYPYDCFPEDNGQDAMDDYDYEDEGLDEDDFWGEFPEEGDWEDEEQSMIVNGD